MRNWPKILDQFKYSLPISHGGPVTRDIGTEIFDSQLFFQKIVFKRWKWIKDKGQSIKTDIREEAASGIFYRSYLMFHSHLVKSYIVPLV